MKKFSHFRRTAVHTFRMPLHADGKRMVLYLDGLDGAILGAGTDAYILSGGVDGLMVETVYKKTGTDILPEAASAFCADPMADFTAGCRPLHVVKRLPGDQGYVLPDRASAGDTQDLHTPAYGKDRLAGFQDTFHETDLEQIYGNVSLAVSFLRFFAEQERRDIIAAAEKKSVAQSGVFVEQVVAPYERKYERNAFCVAHGLNIWISDKLAVLSKTADNDSDLGFHSFSFTDIF